MSVSRRLKFVLKNPLSESNLLLFFREAMQDEVKFDNEMIVSPWHIQTVKLLTSLDRRSWSISNTLDQ